MIRRLVREGAESCRDAGLKVDQPEQAVRQYTIVTLNCLQGEPVDVVAAKLGILPRQCYRERADICTRIAKYIQQYANAPQPAIFPLLDVFRVRMNHAALRAQTGDFSGALDTYANLAQSASVQQKIEVLCRTAMVLVNRGDLQKAADTISSAVALLDANRASLGLLDVELVEVHINLARWRVAYELSDDSYCMDLIGAAVSHVDQTQWTSNDFIRELHAEVFFERGKSLRRTGDQNTANAWLSVAETTLLGVHAPSPVLSLHLALLLCRARNSRLINTCDWQPARRRLENLKDC